MAARLRFEIWDVFTDRAFAGNPFAIVHDAGGLGDRQMQALARQFNLSETIFLAPPRDPAHAASARIFMPALEISFAGHPTIGAALALAQGRDGTIVLEERAGDVPVRVAGGEAELTAPVLPAHRGDIPTAEVAAALGLAAEAVRSASVWSGGPTFLFAELADLDALGRARVVEPAWSALMARCGGGTDSVHLRVAEAGGLRVRMFSPGSGIPEDPATGSAAAVLAGVLHAEGGLRAGETMVTLRQGIEMGRPSKLRLTAEAAGGRLVAARVAGRAVPVAEGRIAVPEA